MKAYAPVVLDVTFLHNQPNQRCYRRKTMHMIEDIAEECIVTGADG